MSLIDTLILALEASPDNVVLRQQVASMLMEETRYDEAIPYFEGLNTPEAKIGIVHCYFLLGDSLKAAAHVKPLLEMHPTHAQANFLAAQIFESIGLFHEARQYYLRAVTTDPTLASVSFELKLNAQHSPNDDDLPDEHDQERLTEHGALGHSDDEFIDFLEKPSTRFIDVGGHEALKESIRLKIIYPFEQPELFAAYGKSAGGGLLLYGPPGCGKTHLARATAGECKARFICLGIHDILDMYIGQSERNIHKLFELARRVSPTVIFIDEMDALAATRSQQQGQTHRNVTNQFLAELDGIGNCNENILVLGATNLPWNIDPAFKRPGRFDRTLFVPPPDEQARIEIFQMYLSTKPTEAIIYSELAKKSEGYSGADVRAVCDYACDLSLQEALKSGKPKPIQQKQLLEALKHVKPSITEWFETAKNYATYSNEGGSYDDVLGYLSKAKKGR